MLAFLDKLKTAVQDFAAREEKLNNESGARLSAQAKAFETAVQEGATHEMVAQAETEAVFHAEREKRQSRFERRKAKINEAHKSARRSAMERIAEHERHRKHN